MYSFDVFDTLITRMTATPEGIFAVMGYHIKRDKIYSGISSHIRDNFYTLRIEAEKVARFHNESIGKEEIVLEDIYEALSMSGDLDKPLREKLCRLEVETELSNVLPVLINIERLKKLLAQRERVILVSEMYLPEKSIRQMLVKVDRIFEELPLYVSSELSAKKCTGSLYRKIKELEKVEYSSWIHYGDNYFQDVQVPRSLGICTKRVKTEPWMIHEKKTLKMFASQPAWQLIAGCARYTRAAYEEKGTAARMGSSICAPLIFGYVNWMLQECGKKGIRRLYFIARDGYLPKIIADKIIASKNLPIETHYIYGSRRVWRMSSLCEEHFNLSELLYWSYSEKIQTSGDLADFLEIPMDVLAPFLPYGSRKPETELSTWSLYKIIKKLQHDRRFIQVYLKFLEEKRMLAVAYLKQEIDVQDDAFAFVDASGIGLNQGCLRQLMTDFYKKSIHSFFFRIDRVNMAKGCVYHVFFPSRMENHLITELFFRAPHGQTNSYQWEDGIVKPTLVDFEDRYLMEHGFGEQQEAIEHFIDYMIKIEKQNDIPLDLLVVFEAYFRHVATSPDKETREYFATFPNDETGYGNVAVEYAPKLTREDILNIFLRRMYWENIRIYYKGSNLEYSLLRCNKEERKLIQQCKQEYFQEWGKRERAEKEAVEQKWIEHFGHVAYYPCELLEEKIILYGAGKFGRKLHERIVSLGTNKIVKWVDSKIATRQETRDSYPDEIESLEGIEKQKYDQIVIAVLDEKVAKTIQKELIQKGIPEEKIFWVSVYYRKNPLVKWEFD